MAFSRSARGVVLAACGVLGVMGCASSAPTTSSLVVGLAGEELRTAFSQLRVTTSVGGEGAKETLIVRDGNGVLPLPAEVLLQGPPGAPVEVSVVGIGPSIRGGGTELLTRRATTTMPSEKRLLRLTLDARCAAYDGSPVVCGTGQTCQGGRCVTSEIPLGALEPYEKEWAVNAPDACRPNNAGAPEVILGKGQTDYGTLAPNEAVRLERGPQGGHHLWVAVRMKNLKQAGARTAITGVQPETGLKATPTAFVFTFDTDEGGYCKLYGLRFQVDAGGALGQAHKPFLGKALDITVEVTDIAGKRASSTQRVMVGDKLLCPDGTEKCNE